jgi:hypothetical protein
LYLNRIKNVSDPIKFLLSFSVQVVNDVMGLIYHQVIPKESSYRARIQREALRRKEEIK